MKIQWSGVISADVLTLNNVLRSAMNATVARFVVLIAACLVASTVNANTYGIYRVNLDGSGMTELVTAILPSPVGIALDVDGGQMYWSDGGGIQRANLDGSEVTELVTGTATLGIALDVDGGQMYWCTSSDLGTIQRANLDGSEVTELVTGISGQTPSGIALDLDAGHIYFAANAVVPLPASIWLFGSGLIGLIGIARRKKS